MRCKMLLCVVMFSYPAQKMIHGETFLLTCTKIINILKIIKCKVKGGDKMKKIAIFNQKGGVGKTTISVNLAGMLALYNDYRVLLVDCDAQSNASNYLLDMDNAPYTMIDVIERNVPVEKCIYPVEIVEKKEVYTTGISILPTDKDIDDTEFSSANVVKKILEPIEDKFDFCILDCPPQKTQGAITALCAADYVLVPMRADTDSIKGYDMVLKLVQTFKEQGLNTTIEILGIIINAFDNKGVQKYIEENLREQLGDIVFESKIRNTTYIEQARFFGKPICVYGYRAKDVIKDYTHLTNEILVRIKDRDGKVGK